MGLGLVDVRMVRAPALDAGARNTQQQGKCQITQDGGGFRVWGLKFK
jgi:hypothetical protein